MAFKNNNSSRGRLYSAEYLMTEGIVLLSILQMFLSATIPSLKLYQIPVEIVLIVLLLYACSAIKYDRWQILLLYIFGFVTVISFTTVSPEIFMINAKQNGMAVLTLLYFSKAGVKSRLIFPVFFISVVLLIVNQVTPEVVAPLIALTFNDEFNLSRFGGFFLNAHFNAFFLAIALIYYGYKRRLYGFGLVILYITASKFVLVSYFSSLITKTAFIKNIAQSRLIALVGLIGLILSVLLLVKNSNNLIYYLASEPYGLSFTSVVIILMQLFDPIYYTILLNPFPGEILGVSADAIHAYSGYDGHIEIGYLYLASQLGFFLGIIYLYMLLRFGLYFRTFILVSLLHGAFILSPLVIYMVVFYSREIRLHKVKMI